VNLPVSVASLAEQLGQVGYVASPELATALFLALKMQRPLFIEGEPGTGKTELAKAWAQLADTELIRLQCYEGLDISQAAYEWNVARQMLEIRVAEAGAKGLDTQTLYRRELLVERPLLRALTREKSPVLLIDELDRADEAFEAFLLELLAENQITVPELGTIVAKFPPVVIITSNRTREIHDALKRRCLYHWVDYPSAPRELEIVRLKAPMASATLSLQVVEFVQRMRTMDLFKLPGVAETIDWTNALVALNAMSLDPETVNNTLGALLKYQDDIARMQGGEIGKILDELRAASLIEH
jgi:MoxR-like ATPase